MNRIIYINGEFVREDEAKISPFNRGLLYGDGIFESMRSYKGGIFGLLEHFERISGSSAFLGIALPFDLDEEKKILDELLKRNSFVDVDSRIRINLIRGEGKRGLPPCDDAGTEVIISAETVSEKIDEIQKNGVKAVIIRDFRLDSRSALTPHKTLNYIAGILGLMEIKKMGGDEGIFLNYDGLVCEGVTSNIFMAKDGALLTPSLSAGILPGITRNVILKVGRGLGIKIKEQNITEADLFGADEIFITSSIREVVPVNRLDKVRYDIGPVTLKIQAGYKNFVRDYLNPSRLHPPGINPLS